MLATLLIDGFNLLHAAVLKGRDRAGWWRADRQRQVVRLAAQLAERAAQSSVPLPSASPPLASGSPPARLALPLHVVFDRRPGPRDADPASAAGGAADPSRVVVHHAPSADDWIVAECQRLEPAAQVVVVSADRALIDRAGQYGARRLSPWAFAAWCGSFGRAEPGQGEPTGGGGSGP